MGWQYRLVDMSDCEDKKRELIERLNEYGKEGWRVVPGASNLITVLMERRAPVQESLLNQAPGQKPGSPPSPPALEDETNPPRPGFVTSECSASPLMRRVKGPIPCRRFYFEILMTKSQIPTKSQILNPKTFWDFEF